MRTIMRGYLRQIDSLNTLNKNLIKENVSYRKEISSANLRAEVAEEKASELSTKVRQGAVIRARGIRLVPLKAVKYFYNLAVLPAYLRRTHAFYVGLASDMLLTKRSVVVLHDIRPLVMDTDKGFFRFKFWVHCLSTKWFAQRVFTVSDNQRHLISEKLGIPLDLSLIHI